MSKISQTEEVQPNFQFAFRCLQDLQISLDYAEMISMAVEIPEVSEDCLYLNIYTPAKPAEDAKLPVISSTE